MSSEPKAPICPECGEKEPDHNLGIHLLNGTAKTRLLPGNGPEFHQWVDP